jgi:hypothetical protein
MHLAVHHPIRVALFGLLAALALSRPAVADGDKHIQRVVLLPKYQQECSACHLAYPPGLLPAASWQRVMTGLSKHFGTDASLDAATVREISSWLAAHAGTVKAAQVVPADDRITRSAWFSRKHHEVSAATWKLPAVKSAANCAACHIRSDQGDFNEHNVRIPR